MEAARRQTRAPRKKDISGTDLFRDRPPPPLPPPLTTLGAACGVSKFTKDRSTQVGVRQPPSGLLQPPLLSGLVPSSRQLAASQLNQEGISRPLWGWHGHIVCIPCLWLLPLSQEARSLSASDSYLPQRKHRALELPVNLCRSGRCLLSMPVHVSLQDLGPWRLWKQPPSGG